MYMSEQIAIVPKTSITNLLICSQVRGTTTSVSDKHWMTFVQNSKRRPLKYLGICFLVLSYMNECFLITKFMTQFLQRSIILELVDYFHP